MRNYNIFGLGNICCKSLTAILCSMLFATTLLANISDVSYANTKVTIRGSNSFEPFEYIDEKGEIKGFNIDITKALMRELGWEYDLQLNDFEEANQSFRDGTVDIMTGMVYSKNYSEFALLSLPTNSSNLYLFTLDTYHNFKNEQIRGKRIIVQEGGL